MSTRRQICCSVDRWNGRFCLSLNSGTTVWYKHNAQSLRLFGLLDDVNDAHRGGANRLQNKNMKDLTGIRERVRCWAGHVARMEYSEFCAPALRCRGLQWWRETNGLVRIPNDSKFTGGTQSLWDADGVAGLVQQSIDRTATNWSGSWAVASVCENMESRGLDWCREVSLVGFERRRMVGSNGEEWRRMEPIGVACSRLVGRLFSARSAVADLNEVDRMCRYFSPLFRRSVAVSSCSVFSSVSFLCHP